MQKKVTLIAILTVTIILSVAVIASQANSSTVQSVGEEYTSVTEPQIYCTVQESKTTGWYQQKGNPVLASYDTGESFASLPTVDLGAKVTNNGTVTLYNVKVIVTYLNVNHENCVDSIDAGIVDVGESKQVYVYLTNPLLTSWTTEHESWHGDNINRESVTVPVLTEQSYSIVAYGTTRP